MRNRFGTWLAEKSDAYDDLVLLVGDIGFGIFDDFRQNSEEKFLNCGIAEQNMIGVAAGLAGNGMRPIVYTIIPFLIGRPYEFVKNLIGHQHLPVILVGVGGGLSYDNLGFTHYAREDLILSSTIPNLTTLIPFEPDCVPFMLEEALESDSPTYIRLMKGGETNIEGPRVKLNGGTQFFPKQKTIALVTYGSITAKIIEISHRIKIELNLDTSVFAVTNPESFDPATLFQFDCVLLIEEQIFPGISLNIFNDAKFPKYFEMLHLSKDANYKVGTRDELLDADGLSADNIILKVKKLYHEAQGS